ncbi:MAG: pilus assembly PilX N-terminal domain-containing protein [Balneolales bacterium]|nr:pilus assembly PilX N-terminal domain-containing protein [Balneolales bacterium]
MSSSKPFIPSVIKSEEGSALATVLILIVIISLFIGIIFSGVVLQARFVQRDIDTQKAFYAAEKGIYLYLDETNYQQGSPVTNRFVLADGSEIQVEEQPFGGFLDITSTAVLAGQSRSIRVLMGDHPDTLFNHAVVMGDSLADLTLTGTTVIEGDIAIKNRNVNEENYKGVSFSGSFTGTQVPYPPNRAFPVLHTEAYELQEQYYSELPSNETIRRFLTEYDGRGVPARDTLYFNERTEWSTMGELYYPNELLIVVNGNFVIDGAYTFRPFTKIIVTDTLSVLGEVKGDHLLLYAGKLLEIGGEAAFSTQAMSPGSISVSGNAYLEYPSMVYSSKAGHTGGDAYSIQVSENSVIDGNLVFPNATNLANRELLRVIVKDNATVRGAIYNAGITELEGVLYGTVFTHQFYFYDSPTTYINWLKDVQVNVENRPSDFVVPIGISDSTRFKLLDWYEVD